MTDVVLDVIHSGVLGRKGTGNLIFRPILFLREM